MSVVHREGPDGTRSYAARAVEPRLAAHLARTPLGFAQRSAGGGRWVEIPSPRATVILSCAGSFGRLPAAFAAGLTDASEPIETGGEVVCVDLKLTPLGAHGLLGLPMDELTGRTVDLVDLLGVEASRLEAQLAEAEDWGSRLDLVDGFLLRRAEVGPRPSADVVHCYRRLVESRGRARVADLVAETGRSHRHLTIRFRREVGLAPKRLARVIRFRYLLERLDRGDELARAAFECGYSDQPHLNREFRSLAATTPTEYLARAGSSTPG